MDMVYGLLALACLACSILVVVGHLRYVRRRAGEPVPAGDERCRRCRRDYPADHYCICEERRA
jgi:hypothetical protein